MSKLNLKSRQKSIGNRIKGIRKRARSTQKNLAELCNLNYRHYQNIEAGNVDLKLSTIFRVADALEIGPTSLCSLDRPFDAGTFNCQDCKILKEPAVGILILGAHGEVFFVNDFLKRTLADIINGEDLAQRSKNFILSAKIDEAKAAAVFFSGLSIAGRHTVNRITTNEGRTDGYVVFLMLDP